MGEGLVNLTVVGGAPLVGIEITPRFLLPSLVV